VISTLYQYLGWILLAGGYISAAMPARECLIASMIIFLSSVPFLKSWPSRFLGLSGAGMSLALHSMGLNLLQGVDKLVFDLYIDYTVEAGIPQYLFYLMIAIQIASAIFALATNVKKFLEE